MLDKLDRSVVLWYQNHRRSRMKTTRTPLSRQYILQREKYIAIKRSQGTEWSFFSVTEKCSGGWKCDWEE